MFALIIISGCGGGSKSNPNQGSPNLPNISYDLIPTASRLYILRGDNIDFKLIPRVNDGFVATYGG